jgi:hypothetical protein
MGLSPKSLNRRECTPRKKRMQEIFDVSHENFLSAAILYATRLTLRHPRVPPMFFRIDTAWRHELDKGLG